MEPPPSDPTDIALRLLAATAAGMILGCNRDLKGKPTGMRTLGLVALGTALVAVATTSLEAMRGDPNALSRVIQGVIQGLMAGVGFIGAGVVLRRPDRLEVHGLTTAATVWMTAALGIAAALADWIVVGMGLALALGLLLLDQPMARLVERLTRGRAGGPAQARHHRARHRRAEQQATRRRTGGGETPPPGATSP